MTSFSFTASPSPLANLFLVDDGTSANTTVFSNFGLNDPRQFQTDSISETVPSGWNFSTAVCSVTSGNGGSANTASAPSITIAEGGRELDVHLHESSAHADPDE